MKQTYGLLAFLAFLSILFHSTVSIAPDPEARTFTKLCRQPQTWDLVFQNGAKPIGEKTPEQAKADLLHFAAVYRSRTEIHLAAGMIISLLVFVFSVTGWFRERHFEKRQQAEPGGPAIPDLPS